MSRIGKSRGLIGVGLFVCMPGLALAAPKAAPSASSAPSTAPSGAFPAPATSAAPTAAPGASAAPSVAPSDAAPPAAPPADATAPTALPPEAAPAPAEAEEEEAPAPRRKHKKKRRHRHVDEDEDLDEDEDRDEDNHWTESEQRREHKPSWSARDSSFLIGAERLTAASYWTVSETESFPSASFGGTSTTSEKNEASGVDVSFLGNAPWGSVNNVPRLGFDGRLPNGLTLGGALSYIVSSSDTESTLSSSSSPSSSTVKRENPTHAAFLMAARIGVLFEASRYASFWLRGGGTRLSVSTDTKISDPNSGLQSNFTKTETVTLYEINLEPQVVFTPVEHVGIALGVNLDICASGSRKTSDDAPVSPSSGRVSSEEHDVSASSYGASAGLIALF